MSSLNENIFLKWICKIPSASTNPDLPHLRASFDCFWSFEGSINADYSRAWMENRVFQWQYSFWTTNASNKNPKSPNSVHSGILSLYSFTHFGSLRGLLHPGKSFWHVPLSFLTLLDTWNDLGAETRMTSLVPPSVSCGLQSSWHVQLLSPFAWPALPTHKVQNLHQNRNLWNLQSMIIYVSFIQGHTNVL